MSQRDLWISVLKRLQPTITKMHFLTWFQHTTILDNQNGKVMIGLPNAFAENKFREKYTLKILQAIQEVDDSVKEVDYEVCARLGQEDNNEGIDVRNLFSEKLEKKVRKVRNLNEVKISKNGSEKISSGMFNGRYTLDSFVAGQENRLPHAACTAVANMPGGIYNPLYIYGGVGLGKTHLLQAVGLEILRMHPDKIIQYLTAERFVSEVVDAIGKRHMSKFKDRYRNVDCFLVDDVQFFARKDSSQQEFFHTFNELYNRNKQIVLTSDRAPSELQDLDKRLVSRFGMGMVVELLFPEYETRLAILHQKCQEYSVLIDPGVLDFIAQNVHNSVRELEGVLRQTIAESDLHKTTPTIKSVAEILKRMDKAQKIIGLDVESKKAGNPVRSAEDVMNIVAEYYGVSVDMLVSDDRHREYMLPRQICMYLIKKELGDSYEKIGLNFGGRNHTTIMHACKKTEASLGKDIRLVRDINAIRREMGL